MTASISITLQCRVTTQKGDKVAVTGAHKVLGEWDPMKLKFMKPKKSIHDRYSLSSLYDVSSSLNFMQ